MEISGKKGSAGAHPGALLPSAGVPAPSPARDGSCRGEGPLQGLGGDGIPVPVFLDLASPAAASFGSKASREAEQPQGSQLRVLAVPCSSGVSLVKYFSPCIWKAEPSS